MAFSAGIRVHAKPESAFTFRQNDRSRQARIRTAVTFNDVMAAGIMRVLYQQGISLPQQLSIVGFDDVVLARYLHPALTTMHYPVEQMARCAAQLAIQLQEGAAIPPSANSFTAELIIRDSVAPASASIHRQVLKL